MKIILLEDIRTLGKKGEVTEVADGYGRNLISKKKAKEATGKNLNDLKLKKANDEKVAAEKLDEAQKLGEEIKDKIVELSLKAGKDGRTFGSVSSKEISEAIKKQWNMDIDKKKLDIAEPIKSLGVHEVKVKLHTKVTTTIRVKVSEAN
ncbi:MAG: 50S ribosomal protein L9 [Eubacterium sp.]|nr:50S ribosomal protein L9 [Eubacterium sp.]